MFVDDQIVLKSVCSTFLMGAAGAFVIKHNAHKVGLLDKPCERSSHVSVTPKGGGIGILAALLLLAFFLRLPLWFWVPAAAVSIISLMGDRMHLSQVLRLCIQFVCAAALIAGHQIWGGAPAGLAWPLSIILWGCFAVYIVGTANCYNFMDGINGIAGLTGVVSFAGLACYALNAGYSGAVSMPLLSVSIAAACMGFLPFNCPKARVFMGDVGSILLGFLFASSVVVLSDSLLDFVCLNSFLFPFYADEIVTMVVRIRGGESLLQAHRRHIYQIAANQKAVAHWKVSTIYALAQLIIGGTTLAIRPLGAYPVMAWLLLAFSIFLSAGIFIRRFEAAPAMAKGAENARVAHSSQRSNSYRTVN